MVIERRSSGPYIRGSRINSYGPSGRKEFPTPKFPAPPKAPVPSGYTLEQLRRIQELMLGDQKMKVADAVKEVLGDSK